LAESNLPKLPQPLRDALAKAVQDENPAVRSQAVRTAAVLQVPQLDEPLLKLSEDKEKPAELRLEALRAVVPRHPKLSAAGFELLLAQLGEDADPLSRLAAAEILGRAQLTDAQALQVLRAARGDALLSPTVLLPALGRSPGPETAATLLDYLTESLRNGWRPGEQELDKILTGLPPDVRGKAAEVRDFWKQGAERQKARLAELEPLLTGGKAERGRAVFFGKKVACATCHRVGNEGGQVGPDLTKVGAVRSGRDILEAVIVPSSTIAQGFDNYQATTADGRVTGGVIARQTADVLVLRDSSGAERRLRRDQVQELRRLPTSLMPEGLERALTADEFRDLLAFLQSLK
jgi:putative heme-binding domain-containing protein